METKKSGIALIYVITVISALIVVGVAFLSAMIYYTEENRRDEKLERLRLLAESGIEEEMSILREKIYLDPNIISSPDTITGMNDFTITQSDIDNATCKVKFTISETHNGIDCYKIYSEASIPGSLKKSYTVYIDKSNINNRYFDAIFGNILTTSDKINNSGTRSLYISPTARLNNVLGNFYFQGSDVNVSPYYLRMINSPGINNIMKVNSNTFTYSPGTQQGNISITADIPSPPSVPAGISYISNMFRLGTLNIKGIITDYSGISSGVYPDPMKAPTQPIQEAKVVCIKIRPVDGAGNDAELDFDDFVSYTVKKYIMEKIIHYNQPGFTYDPNAYHNNSASDEVAYTQMYKVYLIDGNVSIDNRNSGMYYINHIIFSTKKVTIKNYLNLYNSSIYAKQICIDNYAQVLNMYGIPPANGTNLRDPINHSVELPSPRTVDGDIKYQDIINEYLIKNLSGFADGIDFTIVDWVEY